jgi:hypothetical protein
VFGGGVGGSVGQVLWHTLHVDLRVAVHLPSRAGSSGCTAEFPVALHVLVSLSLIEGLGVVGSQTPQRRSWIEEFPAMGRPREREALLGVLCFIVEIQTPPTRLQDQGRQTPAKRGQDRPRVARRRNFACHLSSVIMAGVGAG